MNKIETGIYTRISKRTAKKMYNDGKSVYIVPCKVYANDNNYWIKPYEIKINKDIDPFDRIVNSFEYYNCNHELGYYTAFYIKMEG